MVFSKNNNRKDKCCNCKCINFNQCKIFISTCDKLSIKTFINKR